MGKTRDPFKKTGNIKRICHVMMVMIKERNGKDLTEAEKMNKRQQVYTELYKKGLKCSDNHDSLVITYARYRGV